MATPHVVDFIMKAAKNLRLKNWLQPNATENHATTFCSNPARDRLPLVGLKGRTVTSLKPTGEIRVKGRTFDAVAEGSFIDSDQPIRVTGLRDFRLIVKRLS